MAELHSIKEVEEYRSKFYGYLNQAAWKEAEKRDIPVTTLVCHRHIYILVNAEWYENTLHRGLQFLVWKHLINRKSLELIDLPYSNGPVWRYLRVSPKMGKSS